MSSKGSSGGSPSSTTTVSSLLVQAGGCRIVIALLKCGEWVQLQLAESVPNLLEIGSNQEETKKLLQDHELLLAKIKGLEGQVWDLLCEADKTAAENKDQESVYDAMAETLGDAWDSLVIVLEKRRALLKLTSDFFENALEFAIKIDQVEAFLQNSQEFENLESLKALLHQHEHHTKELLEKSLVLLNKSHDLTEFIEEFKSDGPNINPEFVQGAHSSCLKIDSLLEVLQDRRRQLDKYLKLQRQGLEQVLQICQWHHQESQITSWYKKAIKDYFHKQNLGSSLKENEELCQEHKEMENKVKEWNSAVEELKSDSLRILFSEDYAEKEHLKLSSQKMNLLQVEVNRCMEERKAWLQEANDFFAAAKKAQDILGKVEASLKLLSFEGLSKPILQERQKEVKDGTAEALQKGHILLSKGDTHSSWMISIQEMVDGIQERVNQLMKQRPVDEEFASRKHNLTASLDDYLKKASTKIKNIGPVLSAAIDPGSSVPESEEVLNRYLELANQTKEMTNDLELAVRLLKEMEEFESTDVATFSNKTELLNEELATLNRNIALKLEILKPYVAFLKSSNEAGDDAHKLKELYVTEPAQEESEFVNEAVMQLADTQWQMVLKKILSTQDMGHDFLNLVKMVNDNLILNVENVVQVTENTIGILSKEKEELTRLWTAWKLNMDQVKSIKQQCGKFNEQFKNTTQSLNVLQEALRSAAGFDLGSNLGILVKLQNKFHEMKPQFQQLNAEVEYTVKLSEQLSLKGLPDAEKSKKIRELICLHKEIKEKMAGYDKLFNKTVEFHRVKEELESLIKPERLEISEEKDVPCNTSHAQLQLNNAQEKHTQIRRLYRSALTLGMDIISSVKYPNPFNVSVKNLQQQLATLESESIRWGSKADKYEEELSHTLLFCTTRDEIHELRESFKDLKKKFNNMKFNYSKKTEKARNLKTLRIQIQQVETYSEKLQVLKKKADNLKKKILDSLAALPCDKAWVLSESINEVEKHLNEFGKTLEDYKQNLNLMEHLQQMMEECQFWCEEMSATVIRVEKYSSECKTREAVEVLYKQFNKFVDPIVPQQEERIQQITNLAKDLYGTEEGKKYVEKIASKHKEVLDSVSELCSSLTELEDKLGEGSIEEKVANSDPDLVVSELKTEQEIQNQQIEKEYIKEKATEPKQEEEILGSNPVLCPTGEDSVSQGMERSSPAKEDSFRAELLTEETPSGDEYECISPDDISLPPLSETPESNLLHSETELEEPACCSSQSLHVSSCSVQMQMNAGSKRMAIQEPDPLTPAAYTDLPDGGHRKEWISDQLERYSSSTLSYSFKGQVESPFAHSSPEVPETSPLSRTPEAKSAYCMPSEICETHRQCHEVHRSTAKVQRQLHDINNLTKKQSRLHASPDTFSDLLFQSDATRSCQRQMVIREEIKSTSEKNSMVSLSGQAPSFSKLLSNVTVMEGSPVTLEVEVTGFPEPTLTWYKKGQKLTGNGCLELSHKDTKHTLFIQKVCDTDAGLYVVRAKNYIGTVSSSAVLHVKGNGALIKRIDWIIVCALYLVVSLAHWLFT